MADDMHPLLQDTKPLRVELWHGDCLEVMPKLAAAGVKADFVFADLPYASTKHRHTRNTWDRPLCLQSFWRASHIICLKTTQILMTASQPFTTLLAQSNMMQFSYTLVWDKKFSGSYSQAKHMPMRVHEDILLFRKGVGTYNPQMILRDKPIYSGANKCASLSSPISNPDASAYKRKAYTHKFPTSILSFSNRAEKRGLHPTQKPVALLKWLLQTYSNVGDTALDPVAGSFTTAIAAIRNGRHCISIEKDATYFAAGVARVKAEIAASGVAVDLVIHD